VCCLAPPAQTAALAQAVAALPEDYAEMVRLYEAGDTNGALWRLGAWTEERVSKHTSDLNDAVVAIRKCAGCPARIAFSRFPLRAALLLHADREIQQQFSAPQSEQIPVCGVGPQMMVVEHLASILLLVDPQARPFLERLYLGMSRQALWFHCFAEAADWARSGLKHFPRAPSLLLSEGTAAEARAFFTLAPAPRVLGLTPATLRKRESLSAELRDLREKARQSFEAALSVDPDLVEARLRLGRVLWRLSRPEPARLAFEAVLGKAADAPQQYLAHLFLGRILEDSRDFKAAEEHYRVALSMQPLSEIAAVAVSHARFLQGDVEGARVLLRTGLEAVRKRRDHDPWMPYLLPQTPEGETILAELRQSLSR
jgi:tetratricopeptide (TPR) repeat protein